MAFGFFLKFTVFSTALLALLAYLPSEYLLDIDPPFLTVPEPPKFQHGLEVNTKLDQVQKLYEGQIVGPESIAFHNDEMYTGLLDGRIVKLVNRQVVTIAQIGKTHGAKLWAEEVSGRPLGLRFNSKGDLYVADAYYGLYKVDIKTGGVKCLYKSSDKVGGKASAVVNDLDIDETTGDIYFSDSSTKWPLRHGVYGLLENGGHGRLMHYSAKTGKVSILLDGLHFANGVQLSPKGDFVLVSESFRYRVHRYYLRGPKKGSSDIFFDNLPGVPDNIRLSSKGHFWIALCTARVPDQFNAFEALLPFPSVRKVIGRLIYVTSTALTKLTEVYPLEPVQQFAYKLGGFGFFQALTPKHGVVVEVSEIGRIVRSLHSPSGSVVAASQVTEHKGILYIGSPWHNFVAMLKI